MIPLDINDPIIDVDECLLLLSVAKCGVGGMREHDTVSVLLSVFVTCYILAQIDIVGD